MNKNKFKKNRGLTRRSTTEGFTLIEMIIYIGLFGLIMGGALTSVYGILEANARNQAKAMVQEEGAFLLGKIDWAITGVSSANVDPTGRILTLTKYEPTSYNPLVITISTGGDISIKRGTGSEQGLNNSNIFVTCEAGGCFEKILATGDGINPESVSANMIVNSRTADGFPYSQEFFTIKYLRK